MKKDLKLSLRNIALLGAFVLGIVFVSARFGQGEFFNVQTAFGYGGGSGGYSSDCVGITYTDWGECVNGTQTRDIVPPIYVCNITDEQRALTTRSCTVEEDNSNDQDNTGSGSGSATTTTDTSNDQEDQNNDNGQVLGRTEFADGTLIRGTDHKIYVIIGGAKKHIRTLWELARYYRGQEILNVAQEVVDAIPDYIAPGQVPHYPDNTLIRGTDLRIYVIHNDHKLYIPNLHELAAHYAGWPILNVAQNIVDAIPNM